MSGRTVTKFLITIVLSLTVAVIGWTRLQKAVTQAAQAVAQADTRRVHVAESAYASANHGYFDDVSRLCRRGPKCIGPGIGIPDYPSDQPEFLEPDLARPTPDRKDHYIRKWTPNGAPTEVLKGMSPTSVMDYCYSSTPGDVLTRHGFSYSGSGSGVIVWDSTGVAISCPLPPQPIHIEP